MLAGILQSYALRRVISTIPWQIWASLAVVGFLGASAWFVHNRAYNRGFSAAEQKFAMQVEQELARQEEINKQALARAQEEINRLREAKDVRDATISRLVEEAGQDPSAGRPALSSDGVRRLNSILQ